MVSKNFSGLSFCIYLYCFYYIYCYYLFICIYFPNKYKCSCLCIYLEGNRNVTSAGGDTNTQSDFSNGPSAVSSENV